MTPRQPKPGEVAHETEGRVCRSDTVPRVLWTQKRGNTWLSTELKTSFPELTLAESRGISRNKTGMSVGVEGCSR